MTKQEKIDFVLEIMPNVSKIIKFSTEDQLEKLVEQAKEKLDYELTEAAFD